MKTGEGTHPFRRNLPPGEAFESLAARLWPFVMCKEAVYWEVVLDAVEKLLSKETLAEVGDIPSRREYGQRSSKARKRHRPIS